MVDIKTVNSLRIFLFILLLVSNASFLSAESFNSSDLTMNKSYLNASAKNVEFKNVPATLEEQIVEVMPAVMMALFVFIMFLFVIKTIAYSFDLSVSDHFSRLFQKTKFIFKRSVCTRCKNKCHFVKTFRGFPYCIECQTKIKFKCRKCKNQINLKDAGLYEHHYYCSKCYKKVDRHFDIIKSRFKFTDSKTFKINPSREYCGVEIECLNRDRSRNCFQRDELKDLKVNQYTDGSLQGDNSVDSGIEFCTHPANGDELFKIIKNFSINLKLKKYYANKTCGAHFHLNTPQDIKLIKKTMIFYDKFENVFLSMFSNYRRKNKFCKPLRAAYISFEDKSNYERLLSTDSLSMIKLRYNLNERYCWINLASLWSRKGTIEFRLHEGTIDWRKITRWINIHLQIRKFLLKSSFKDILNLKGEFSELKDILDLPSRNYMKKRIEFFKDETKGERDFKINP